MIGGPGFLLDFISLSVRARMFKVLWALGASSFCLASANIGGDVC